MEKQLKDCITKGLNDRRKARGKQPIKDASERTETDAVEASAIEPLVGGGKMNAELRKFKLEVERVRLEAANALGMALKSRKFVSSEITGYQNTRAEVQSKPSLRYVLAGLHVQQLNQLRRMPGGQSSYWTALGTALAYRSGCTFGIDQVTVSVLRLTKLASRAYITGFNLIS